ncbi:hypothetical protein TNIN_51921 [Trichonephila inaurata madagascariensis]|uniref:Uncharacterized protein n=1 Tax=Trichonephila inaurata madagascariensis TaxID=2747483 RepID=A0A8X7C7B4_9ARAC|nr:hypothetical protein TNIN_51921 [Trichonephila inaurata madagascariensis]
MHPLHNSNRRSDRATPLSVSCKGMECVFECPTHILDRVRSLRGAGMGIKVRAKVLESDHLTIRRGGKKRYFSTYIVPPRNMGSNGLKDGSVARKPVQHFLMSVVRLEDIILGNRETQTSLRSSPHSRETGATLIYATSAIKSQRMLPDCTLHPSVSRKGMEVGSISSTAHPRPRPEARVQVQSTPKVRAKVLESEFI